MRAVSTVQEIRSASERLPLEDRAALVAELCGWPDGDWDRKMKADARAGKFPALNEETPDFYWTGQTSPGASKSDASGN